MPPFIEFVRRVVAGDVRRRQQASRRWPDACHDCVTGRSRASGRVRLFLCRHRALPLSRRYGAPHGGRRVPAADCRVAGDTRCVLPCQEST